MAKKPSRFPAAKQALGHEKTNFGSICKHLVQPVEKNIYNSYSTEIFKNIVRHTMPDFNVFSLLDIRIWKRRSHGKRKSGDFKSAGVN